MVQIKVEGLPPGVTFKRPSAYGDGTLKSIMEKSHILKFKGKFSMLFISCKENQKKISRCKQKLFGQMFVNNIKLHHFNV